MFEARQADPDVEAVRRVVDSVPGWLTMDQAHELVRLARVRPSATIVEIGSHQGRSTVALALAGSDVNVTAVDPFVTARLFEGPSVRARFLDNIARAGVADRVTLLTMSSAQALGSWPGDRVIDLVYIDGKHDVVSLLRDLRWSSQVRAGGHLAVHDAFSSIGVTLGLLVALPASRRLVLLHRVGSLAVLQRRPPRPRERLRALIHLPWFARNVAVKLSLRLRLRGVALRIGHTDRFDPY